MNHVKRLVKGGNRCRLTGAVWPRGPPAGAHTVQKSLLLARHELMRFQGSWQAAEGFSTAEPSAPRFTLSAGIRVAALSKNTPFAVSPGEHCSPRAAGIS